MKIAGWEGTNDLIVVPLDDYRMVLGMDFLDKVSPWSFEKDNTMRITKGSMIHIVPLERNNTKSHALATIKYIEGPKRRAHEERRLKEEVEARKVVRLPKEDGVYKEAKWRPTRKTKEKQGTPHPLRYRNITDNRWEKRRSFYGNSVTKKYPSRDLDEDVKGLSGGECHGRSFRRLPGLPRRAWNVQEYRRRPWSGPRHEERPWKTVEDSRSPWMNMERRRRSGATLEYSGSSRDNVERPRRSRKAWECPRTHEKVLEFSRTSWKVKEELGRSWKSKEGHGTLWKDKDIHGRIRKAKDKSRS